MAEGENQQLITELEGMSFLKKVENCSRVVLTRRGNEFVVNNPAIFYNEQTQTYIFVGTPEVNNPNYNTQQLLNLFSQSMQNQHPENCDCEQHEAPTTEVNAAFTDEDVTTVAQEAGVSEDEAREALRTKQGNIVEALVMCRKE